MMFMMKHCLYRVLHTRHIFKCPFFLTFMPLPYMHTIARYYILRALLMNYFIILQMKKKNKALGSNTKAPGIDSFMEWCFQYF